MSTMPRPYPREFREDVVAVARRGEAPIAEIAKDFGIAESCVRNWLRAADAEGGRRAGRPVPVASESEQVRELKRRNKLLEQEVEVLRRAAAYLSQAHLPAK
jgi:transposase-like protein